MKAVASRSVVTPRSSNSSRKAPEHPLLALQRKAGNRAVADMLAQREPKGGSRGRHRRKAGFEDPWTTLTDTWAQGIIEAMQKIYDTSRYVDPKVAGYLQPYGGHLWNLYLSYRSSTGGMFPGAQRLEVYDKALAGLQPAIDKYTVGEEGGKWFDANLRPKIERGRQDVQSGIASERVKGEVAAGREDPGGKRNAAPADAATDPSTAAALVDTYLAGVSKVKAVYGESFDHKAARTRRKAGESRASAGTRQELNAVATLDGSVAVLKTAKSMLTLTDAQFAKKLATLESSGPLGKVRSKVELAKAAVDIVADGTQAIHTLASIRAATTGNQEALKTLRSFEHGDLKQIGRLASGIGILANALTILNDPTSKEGLEAGVDILATAGKGTPLSKAKDVYDFGKNAVTVLDKDAERGARIDAAMGMIGVAGPIGASLKLTYDGLKALSDLYWGAALGLVAAGVHPATRRMILEAQSIGAGVEKLAATARLLEGEVDPGQRAALQRIAEMQLDWIGKDVRQMIGTARSRSDERDSYGNIRVYRELFAILKVHAHAQDPEAIMRGAIAVMRSAKWAAQHVETVIRAEATDTSLPDAMDWEVEQAQKAEKAKQAAAERKRRMDEMMKGMSASDREWFGAMLN